MRHQLFRSLLNNIENPSHLIARFPSLVAHSYSVLYEKVSENWVRGGVAAAHPIFGLLFDFRDLMIRFCNV